MTPASDETPWERVRRVFDAVATLDPEARDRYLRQLTADPATRDAVQRLIAAHEAMSGTQGPGQAHVADVLSSLARRADDEHVIAGFHIERVLGEGGMGRVYAATRTVGGTSQKVALKVVPFVLRNERAIEQLRRERAILATLEHPNIARLIDAGELADDRPWFAMEYVDGEPITRYCERHALDLRARLALFLDACEAVAYAHRQLVLHRDLKSGNILVDAEGRVRLLDFGIAKSLERHVARQETTVGGGFFSLASAAPEQVLGRATSVATDVYGLGCLLYELLTGHGPFTGTERSREGLVRAIVDEAPPLVSVAANERALRGDVDTIVAKALRKDAADRYRSVDALAADVRNVLAFKPIAARTSERWYRFTRFARRNRTAMAVAAVLGVAALAATAVSVVQWRRAVDALASARLQRDHARGVVDFLVKSVEAADPVKARGRELRADELFDSAVQELDRQGATQDPALRATIAQTLTQLFYKLDRPEAVQKQAAIAHDAFTAIIAPSPEIVAGQHLTDATAAFLTSRFQDALASSTAALENQAGDADNTDIFYNASFMRGRALKRLSKYKLSWETYQNAYEVLSRRADTDVRRLDRLRQAVAATHSDYGDFAKARELYAALLADQRSRDQPDEIVEIETLRGLAVAYGRLREYQMAWALINEAYDRHVSMFGEDNAAGAGLLSDLASATANLGNTRQALLLRQRATQIGLRRVSNTWAAMMYIRMGLDYHFDLRAFDQSERAFLLSIQATPKEAASFQAAALQGYGELLLETDRQLEAESMITQACDLSRKAQGEKQSACLQADADLAYIRFRKYDFDAALKLLTLDVLAERKNLDPTDNWDKHRVKEYDEMAAFFGF